jgi:ABC-2 type transport system ATP-binding protein
MPKTRERGSDMHALTMENVTKHYGQTVVVNDLSLTVKPGRVTGFLGPNGAGKSTVMKILLDLASADHGRAAIGGSRYRLLRDPVRTVGAILESNAFHPGRSGRNHLRILADGSGISKTHVDDLLQLVGLANAADRHVGEYSLGMRQRLGLAVALLGNPPVLVLDEPGNGLDPGGMRWLRDLLRSRAVNGDTVFVSSHLLAEMEQLADDLVVIHQGGLVTTGTVSDLRTAATSVSVRTPLPEPLGALVEAAGGNVQVGDDGGLPVRGLSATEIGDRAHAAGIALHELFTRTGSLEELFLTWTGNDAPREPGAMDEEGVSA